MSCISVRIGAAVLAFASSFAILNGIAALAESKSAGPLLQVRVDVDATATAPGTRPTAMAAPARGRKRL